MPPKSDVRRALVKVALFCAPLAVLAVVYLATVGPVISLAFGSFYDLDYQLSRSVGNAARRDYEVVALGNSRMFRGFDPSAMTRPAYNFAFDDDGFDYYLYKLRWLLAQQKPLSSVVIGVDYFQFSYRNYDRFPSYRRLLTQSGIDAELSNSRYWKRLSSVYVERRTGSRFLYRAALTRLAGKWLRKEPIARWEDPHAVLRDDGYYVVTADKAQPALAREEHAVGDEPDMARYLDQLLALCGERKLRALLVMPPLSEAELRSYAPELVTRLRAEIQRLADAHHARFLDLSRDPRFTPADFADFTHMNQAGAKKLAAIVDEALR